MMKLTTEPQSRPSQKLAASCNLHLFLHPTTFFVRSSVAVAKSEAHAHSDVSEDRMAGFSHMHTYQAHAQQNRAAAPFSRPRRAPPSRARVTQPSRVRSQLGPRQPGPQVWIIASSAALAVPWLRTSQCEPRAVSWTGYTRPAQGAARDAARRRRRRRGTDARLERRPAASIFAARAHGGTALRTARGRTGPCSGPGRHRAPRRNAALHARRDALVLAKWLHEAPFGTAWRQGPDSEGNGLSESNQDPNHVES